MRFASHRDVARAVERGVRRAALPIAYSAGFNPHPRISYAGAAPTGTASEAEYLELSLTRACATAEVARRLDAALPDGIDVIEVTEEHVPLGALPLAASRWHVVLPGVPPAEAARAVEEFLACRSVEVERLTNKGVRRLDARAAVISIEIAGGLASGASLEGSPPGNAVLEMVVQHVIPAVRPDDIFAALRHVAAFAPPSPPVVTRLAQGALNVSADARDGGPGEQSQGLPGIALSSGRRAAAETVETTRPGRETAEAVYTSPAGACNQFPRGVDGPAGTAAPGNLTGDSPDARQRAERERARQ